MLFVCVCYAKVGDQSKKSIILEEMLHDKFLLFPDFGVDLF